MTITHTLRIDMNAGTWMVDVVAENNDDGVIDLIHPKTETEVHLKEDHLYGYDYSVTGPEGTPFAIYLDDNLLTDGVINETGLHRGSGVI